MSFFGKREPETVGAGELAQFLDSVFNKKFASLESRASGIVGQLKGARDDFRASCEDFERLDVEPYTEDLWSPNINAIKNQKAGYSGSLKGLVTEMELEPDTGKNVYARYRAVLESVEDATGKILGANARFKTVLYCYSNHMRSFKRSFSYIERLRDQLREELNRRSTDYGVYTGMGDKISMLNAQAEELDALDRSIGALAENSKSVDTDAIVKGEHETLEKISGKTAELTKANDEISGILNRIDMLTAPLNKASKRFDHGSGKKKHLGDFMSDPINTMRSAADYEDFLSLLGELRKSVESGTLDLKNKSETLIAISALEDSDIHSMISNLNSMKSRKAVLSAETRMLERINDELKEGRNSVAKSVHERELMEKSVDEISKSRMTLKGEIEGAFMKNYGVLMSIIL